MFEGTIRNNLDPLEEYTDGKIWEVFEKLLVQEYP
jgi:ATP-binding cassette, subfamily C (CFTR/MRP), member 2